MHRLLFSFCFFSCAFSGPPLLRPLPPSCFSFTCHSVSSHTLLSLPSLSQCLHLLFLLVNATFLSLKSLLCVNERLLCFTEAASCSVCTTFCVIVVAMHTHTCTHINTHGFLEPKKPALLTPVPKHCGTEVSLNIEEVTFCLSFLKSLSPPSFYACSPHFLGVPNLTGFILTSVAIAIYVVTVLFTMGSVSLLPTKSWLLLQCDLFSARA